MDLLVGLLGIEPSPHACPVAPRKAGLLLGFPKSRAKNLPIGEPGIEPEPRVPKTRILPLYYSPLDFSAGLSHVYCRYTTARV